MRKILTQLPAPLTWQELTPQMLIEVLQSKSDKKDLEKLNLTKADKVMCEDLID